jgi:hypothetical protein
MDKMSSIEQLISEELRAQAEAAVPPPDAWDRFRESIEPTGIPMFDVDSGESGVNEVRGDDLTFDYLLQRPEENAATAQNRGWPSVAMAVAVTILVVVGVVLVAEGNRGVVVNDPAASPTVTEPVPSPTVADPVAPPSVVDALGYRWSRVADDDAVFGVDGDGPAMMSVTAGGPGLVAVGTDGSHYHGEEGHLQEWGDAAVWTSVDGVTWSRVPHDEAVFGGAVMSSVTVGGPGLVAVGGTNSGAAVWTSVDGIIWSRVPHDEAVFGGDADMSSVTAGGPGLVAVGPGFLGGPAAVWTSADGLTWSRVPHDEAVFGGAGMSSVTAGGPGLVAVGWFEEDGENGQGAAVWTSVDGFTWSRVPHDETVFGGEAGQRMTSVTAGGPGLVAVGFDGGGIFSGEYNAPVWTSVDGLTWTRVPIDEAIIGAPGGGTGLESVTVGSRGLIAVGGDANPRRSDRGARVLTSPDGITWSRVPHETLFSSTVMTGVTATGPGLVAVGVTWNTEIDAVVWIATPEK